MMQLFDPEYLFEPFLGIENKELSEIINRVRNVWKLEENRKSLDEQLIILENRMKQFVKMKVEGQVAASPPLIKEKKKNPPERGGRAGEHNGVKMIKMSQTPGGLNGYCFRTRKSNGERIFYYWEYIAKDNYIFFYINFRK